MLFHSYAFLLLFIPFMMLLFFGLSKLGLKTWARNSLLVGSLFFYAYWDIRFMPLLLLSILFNYFVGKRLRRYNKKLLLILAISVNLLFFFTFTYLDIILSIYSSLSHIPITPPEITLPLGISLFTFTQVAFLIDAYKSKTENYDLSSYGLFVAIFPQLFAYPISPDKGIMRQLQNENFFRLHPSNIAKGSFIFLLGLGKKLLIANVLATYVGSVFDPPETIASFLPAWIASLTYAFQLYFDFSSYSDMAIGLGLLFNLELPFAANSPYHACSPLDFAKRMHSSLFDFLHDYLFIPVRESRDFHPRNLHKALKKGRSLRSNPFLIRDRSC